MSINLLTRLYIGAELADFNEAFNLMFSIGDVRNLGFGNCNKSYTLNLPLTKTNKRLIKYINQPDVKSEPSATARLYIGEMLVISGPLIITEINDYYVKAIINSDDWIDGLKDKKLTDLDLSAYDHVYNDANVLANWAASYPEYRYPMINWGALTSGENGANATWHFNDFTPWFSIATLMTEILKPYTISSTWLASAFVKDLYISTKETIAEEAFISNKGLQVAVQSNSDNYSGGNYPGGFNVYISMDVLFKTATLDEGSNWTSNYKYVVPVTGTYRFQTSIKTVNTANGNADLTIMDEILRIYINKNVTTNLATYDAGTYSGTELIDGITNVVDSGYVKLTAGDYITINILERVVGTVNSGTQAVAVYVDDTSTLKNLWSSVNRYDGSGMVISFEERMPDMSQVDFLSLLRDIFNLRFWMDKMKRTIYIEPWDQFLSSTVVDLTPYIDFESMKTELVSSNYNKTTVLRWVNDDSDKSYAEYLKLYADAPGRKDIVLSSLEAMPGFDYRDNKFSGIITGPDSAIAQFTTLLPRIYEELPVSPYTTFNRKIGYNTRIAQWKGLTVGLSWNFNGATKTTYPKIENIDFSDIYINYLMKFFHYIDKGKILTVRMKINPLFIQQFYTVISTAADEGFRPTYKITQNGSDNYYFLQKLTTDGQSAELELILGGIGTVTNPGLVYYVSASGNNTNDGLTQSTPWQTIDYASAHATTPGCIVALKKGDTFTTTGGFAIYHGGTSGNIIVWDGALWGSGANAIIQLSGNTAYAMMNIYACKYVTFWNITIDGNSKNMYDGICVGGYDGASPGSVQNNEQHITVLNCLVENCGDANPAHWTCGIHVSPIHTAMDYIIVQGNTITRSNNHGIAWYSGVGGYSYATTNSYCGSNTITKSGTGGVDPADNIHLSHNVQGLIIESNNITQGVEGSSNGISLDGMTDGYCPSGVIIRYNDVRLVNKSCIWVAQGGAVTLDCYYNKFYTSAISGSAGIYLDGTGGADYTGANMKFCNNTICVDSGNAYNDGTNMATSVCTFRNNLLSGIGAGQYANALINIQSNNTSTTHSNNVLYRTDATNCVHITYNNGGTYIYRNNTISGWEATAKVTDPLLTDRTGFIWTLQAGSPAINAGVDVGLTVDYLGNLITGNPDIGCLEKQ
jgi:hypothetical protein